MIPGNNSQRNFGMSTQVFVAYKNQYLNKYRNKIELLLRSIPNYLHPKSRKSQHVKPRVYTAAENQALKISQKLLAWHLLIEIPDCAST